MRFEFSHSDVVDLFRIIDYAYTKCPKGAAYKQVRYVLNSQIKTVVNKILSYARESLFMVQINRLLDIWKKITGEDYAY